MNLDVFFAREHKIRSDFFSESLSSCYHANSRQKSKLRNLWNWILRQLTVNKWKLLQLNQQGCFFFCIKTNSYITCIFSINKWFWDVKVDLVWAANIYWCPFIKLWNECFWSALTSGGARAFHRGAGRGTPDYRVHENSRMEDYCKWKNQTQ